MLLQVKVHPHCTVHDVCLVLEIVSKCSSHLVRLLVFCNLHYSASVSLIEASEASTCYLLNVLSNCQIRQEDQRNI